EYPRKYGSTPAEAEQIVRNCTIPLQHRIYRSKEEAIRDFQYLNQGTALTAYEFCRGDLTVMPGWQLTWKPILAELHETMNQQITRLWLRLPRVRSAQHRFRRHDYALFRRFLDHDKELSSLGHVPSGSSRIRMEDVEQHKTVEWALRQCLERIGPE